MEEIRSMIEAIECTREGDKPQYDGIIVPEKWFTRLDSDQLRIMYLMKNQTDKSGTDKGGHDIAYIRRHDRTLSDVEDDGGLQTYECPVIIGYMLEKNVSFADVPSNYKMSEEVYTIWKNMSAWVNVDKELTHGTSKTNTDKLRKAAHENENLLKFQIATYQPNVVIGGNTVNLFVENLGNGVYKIFDFYFNGAHKLEKSGRLYYYNEKVIMIDAYHPSYPYKNRIDYCTEIVDAVERWMAEYGY
ncbi:MAG: hypothetical protein H9802_02880 [Candidatus Phocaeicola faecipullorum]|nr:hypothetical protein [Candidatus Phocaeicola faecipullorum]